MKRYFCLLSVLCLLLCGCKAKTPEPPPQPVYSEAPAVTTNKIIIDGTDIGGVYSDGSAEYVNLETFAAAIGGTFDIYEDITDSQAKLTFDGKDYLFTTASDGTEPYKNCLYDGNSWFALKADALSLIEKNEFLDEEISTTYYTAYPKAADIPEGYKVPTLMYHAVSDNMWGIESLFVSPSSLEQQIEFLLENNYTPIFFEDLENVDKINKPVLLTFDDGYDDNFTELLPILEKYKVKATIFVITGSIGAEHYMSEEQLRQISKSEYVSLQSHTVTHEYLSTRTDEQLQFEMHQSKITLARITGKEPFVLCYPTGKYSQASLDATREHYQFGLLMSGPNYVTGDNPVKITRKYISRSTSISEFKQMLK